MDHLTTSMRVMYCRILEDCNVRVISKNEGGRSGRGCYEWFCPHSEIMNISTLNGDKWMKTNYLKRFFHCFTVHFDSLSFIHTNSCTFLIQNMYGSSKLIKST